MNMEQGAGAGGGGGGGGLDRQTLRELEEVQRALGSLETDWSVRVGALQRLEAAAGAVAARGSGVGAFVQRLCAPELRDAVAQQSTRVSP